MANARHGGRVVVLVALLVWPSASVAQTPVAAGRIVSVQGRAEVERGGATRPAIPREPLHIGDVVRTGPATRVAILLVDETRVKLNENSTLRIKAVAPRPVGGFLPATRRAAQTLLELLGGEGWVGSPGQPEGLTIETPVATATIRGTEFTLAVTAHEARLTLIEGQVDYRTAQGGVVLSRGEVGIARAGQSPHKQLLLRPEDAVHWTLYYPPVLYFGADEFPAGADWQGAVRRSRDAYLAGDTKGAFDFIAAVPPTVSDPRFFAYRAHLLLTVGRVDEASTDIERALRLAPDDPDALALQTVIAVAQGDKDRALAIGERAVQVAPTSATAHIALSYAQQARFDLVGARDSVQNAVDLDSKNALAWARLSELWASFAELDRALRAARQAAVLEPNLSRTQTVLGFAYLMRVQTKQAREAFEKAIAFDQADPLPRLGLGLAKIREGKLDDGGREVEVAASLDPGNAIIRSYLGKTYYEEKRTGLAQREYAMAKQLDPSDPTPYLYDAIAKQTTNRPVEALHDLQRAIELNDNRTVYRSRLLLDADEAARAASLGRIYSDLGFQQLALVEGWKSVNTDQTNFSAHRLLADSYASVSRHEIARVSELLQSQLLQPINTTPIQPRLAESNLFLLSSGGPGGLSFNEFNPIFNRDGVTVQATGLGGENGTWAGEGVVAGIYKNLSFSAGYTQFSTNGFRPNAFQDDQIGNVFLQYALTPETSIQAEYRYRNRSIGDLQLNFFQDDFRRNFRQDEERHTGRLGVRHAFSPNSILLGSVIYTHRDSQDTDRPENFINSVTIDFPKQDALSFELQHLFRSKWVDTVAGAGYFYVNAKEKDTIALNIPGLPSPFNEVYTSHDITTKHTNAYIYSYLKAMKGLTFTLGGSVDILDTEDPNSESTNQFNPKLGVVWNPLPNTTLRAAVFRMLKRTLITDQTLEPTQVAGFNQFFDDLNATKGWNYGVAIDQKFTSNLFAGVELSMRDLSIPGRVVNVTTGDQEKITSGTNEYLARTYVFWTPHPWLALSGEYQYERFTREKLVVFVFLFRDVTTHKVPLGIRFFHPSGVSFSVRGTYINQHGRFIRQGGIEFEDGQSDFFVLDTSLSYRLPRRHGFITVGATNVTDQHFRFQETDLRNPTVEPARFFFTRITLAF